MSHLNSIYAEMATPKRPVPNIKYRSWISGQLAVPKGFFRTMELNSQNRDI